MDLILHIGTEKTGTTSIQQALAASRDALAERGILYPALLGTENHMEIAAAAMGPRANDSIQIQELARTGLDLPAYVDAVRARLAAEIEATGANTLLISNEHCHGRLDTPESVQRLAQLLGAPFRRVRVIVYLRRQDQMAVSLHSTRLKGGGTGAMLPQWGIVPQYYDPHGLMARYADVFGQAAITPRLYERNRLAGGDVVRDFFQTAELGIDPPAMTKANPSLSRAQARFLSLFNARVPLIVDRKVNPDRGPVVAAIIRVLPGPPARPARAEAMRFQQQFDVVNRLARERFMPTLDRPTLFDDDFSAYPEAGDDDQPLTEEEFAAFAEALWVYGRKAGAPR
ncbi:hypothetical protein [Paracoccus luteus]|uniref:hypothetical protein n=1 Tax=Paracoccus luteus TaxID=2508543 RepID=UPI00106F6E1A|nr:hypothetical protein [Paracoccus luteus]